MSEFLRVVTSSYSPWVHFWSDIFACLGTNGLYSNRGLTDIRVSNPGSTFYRLRNMGLLEVTLNKISVTNSDVIERAARIHITL